jgi:hypothetical protein
MIASPFMQFGVKMLDFRGISKVECTPAPLMFKGMEVRKSEYMGIDNFVQKIKIWKHKSLKRPVTKRVYTYNKPNHAYVIGRILFVSEEFYEHLLKLGKETMSNKHKVEVCGVEYELATENTECTEKINCGRPQAGILSDTLRQMYKALNEPPYSFDASKISFINQAADEIDICRKTIECFTVNCKILQAEKWDLIKAVEGLIPLAKCDTQEDSNVISFAGELLQKLRGE